MNVQQITGQAEQAAKELSEKAKATARDAGAAADLYVHEYAWTSVAAVAVLAWAMGYLLGRRSG